MANKNESTQTPVPAVVENPGLSRQSQFSTVKENKDLPEQNPAPGRHVLEELGQPKKGKVGG